MPMCAIPNTASISITSWNAACSSASAASTSRRTRSPSTFSATHCSTISRRATAKVNGEIWTDTNMSDGIYTFADLISFISGDVTLYPGEFIAAGTMSNGCGMEHDRYLKPGDTVELWMDGIGTLRNKLVAA